MARRGKPKKKFRMTFREFINLPGWKTRAYIRAEVEDTSSKKIEKNEYNDGTNYRLPHPDLTFSLGDCSSDIHLEFDTYDYDEMENNLYKAEMIYQAAKAFRAALKKEMKLFQSRRAKLLKEGVKEKNID